MHLGTLGYDAFMFYFEKRGLNTLRTKVLKDVHGDVLELGPGTGVNLRYCNPKKITSLTYVDLKFKPGLEKNATNRCPSVSLIEGDAQHLPFEDNHFDAVVFTLVFCSVDDALRGLREVRRVLKDEGTIYFIEHVEPPTGWMKPAFNKVNPAWHSFSGGCNLNRNTIEVIEASGFDLTIMGKVFSDIFIGGTGKKTTIDTNL